MSTAPREIRTERLLLRCWTEPDAAELRATLDACDAHLRPWIPFMKHEPRSLDGTRAMLAECRAAFAKGERYRYAVREHASGTLIGETMLIDRGGPDTLEAGYWLHQDHCGKGYATEATRALLPVAFDALGLSRVILCCDEQNAASIQVARRLGAVHVDTEDLDENGRRTRLLVFERRRSE